MRRTFMVAVTMLTAATTVTAAKLPREARIVTADAPVRSGPGDQFYATATLQAQESVTIYRVTREGWCAVRPPHGSFSYVRADHVRETGIPRLLEVVASNSRTRVGSQLNTSSNVEYVKLKPGETLAALSAPVRLDSNRQRWYKVQPPAGEFRWIHARHLRATPARRRSTTRSNAVSRNLGPAARDDRKRTVRPATPVTASSQLAPEVADLPAGNTVQMPPRTTAAVGQQQSSVASDSAATAAAGQESAKTQAGLEAARQLLATISAATQTEAQPSQLETAAGAHQPVKAEATTALTAPQTLDTTEIQASPLRDQMKTEPIRSPSDRQATASRLTTAAEPTSSGQDAAIRPVSAVDESVQGGNQRVWVAAESSTTPSPVEADLSLDPRDPMAQLIQLELQLSRSVTQEVDEWDLSSLYQRAYMIAQNADNPKTRDHAAQLLGRTQQFMELQRRHRQLIALEQQAQAGTISLASAIEPAPALRYQEALGAASVPAPPQPVSEAMPQYNGQGWLVPVFTSRTDIPQFALTDSEGNVLQFVIPRPGLNLRRYRRREVGIIGRSTAPSQGQTPTLIAERVVALDRHRR